MRLCCDHDVVLFCSQAHKAHTNLEVATRLKVAAGLAEMENRKYKNAARYFLQASFDHCQCPDVCVCVCVLSQYVSSSVLYTPTT